MNADDPRAKWDPIDGPAAKALVMSTSAPGMVFPLATSALPAQIQKMPNVVSYFVSSYAQPLPLANAATASGQMAVVRGDGSLGKAYNYIFATSSNGQVVFNGPHYHFENHHFASSSPVPVEALFCNVPVRGDGKA